MGNQEVFQKHLPALANLSVPLFLVDREGKIHGGSRAIANLFPHLAYHPTHLGDIFLDPPEAFDRWLPAASQPTAMKTLTKDRRAGPTVLFAAHPLLEGDSSAWVVHLLPVHSAPFKRLERELLLRIGSVPLAELMKEGRPLTKEAPQEAPITQELLEMLAQVTGAATTLLFSLEEQAPPQLIGYYGMEPAVAGQLIGVLEQPSTFPKDKPFLLAEAASAGLVYTLKDGPQDSFLERIQPILGYSLQEVWLDGIGGFGAAVCLFSTPPNPELRPFSTEAHVRLGRMLDWARTAQNLYLAYRELQKTHEKLVESGKLMALGEMAAGITHELRQPVTALSNFLDLIFQQLASGKEDKVKSHLEEYRTRANRNIGRLTSIIDHLRGYTRQDQNLFRATNLANLLKDINQTYLDAQFRSHNIRLIWQIEPGLPQVEVDSARLEQVVLNLASNAIDAVEGVAQPEITIGLEKQGNDKVRLFVKDNGCGIPKELLPKITDPFFSTKPAGKGTGLGLAITKAIVKSHGGELEASNNSEGGACLAVLLMVEIPADSRKELLAASNPFKNLSGLGPA